MTRAPRSEDELLARARAIAGHTYAELATDLGWEVPRDQRHAKGWVGRLIEEHLGATATSKPVPDFEVLGIELKTLPIDAKGRPKESTYVCTVPLKEVNDVDWEGSTVRAKLARVLWVPVEADPAIPFPKRCVGSALLWSPAPEQEEALKRDWEAHLEAIRAGWIDRIDAGEGACLQIRPKAAHSGVLRWASDGDDDYYLTLPRGFYLRTAFTRALLARYYTR